jgi:fructoselysine-6-P-deglycase FrlB-like protein
MEPMEKLGILQVSSRDRGGGPPRSNASGGRICKKAQMKNAACDDCLSFESTLREIEAQAFDLPDYLQYLDSLSLDPADPNDSLFVGAGDSYAAASFAERLANFGPRSFDPYDLIRNPQAAKDKSVFIISVSGKTRANLEVAEAVRPLAKEVIVITANEESTLAKSSSREVHLKFSKSPGLTPGTNSFTCSLLAMSAILGNRTGKLEVAKMIEQAKGRMHTNLDFPSGVHFVGSGLYYPIAMYGYAKLCEFVGGPAEYQLLEEFSHMNLFSVRDKDLVVILPAGQEDRRSLDLHASLERAGIKSLLLAFEKSNDKISQAIYYSIQLQYLALTLAQLHGLKEPAFLQRKNLLEISDRMIY